MDLINSKRQYKNALTSWFLFDYCLPIIFIIGFWPVALFLLKMPYAFERVFSSADLIPVGSILMLGAAREIETEKRMERITQDFDAYKNIGIFFPIVMLFVYAVLKYYSMTYSFPADGKLPVDGVIYATPFFSLISVVLAGCYCFMTKWGIISSLKCGD